MEFRRQIKELLRPKERRAATFETSLGARFLGDVSAVMPSIVGVLKEMAAVIPGTELTLPIEDPRECGFYVAAARVPYDPDAGFVHPVRIYFLAFPPIHPPEGDESSLRIVRLVAIGSAVLTTSLRPFLRAWNDAAIGGGVVYEGVPDPEQVREACQEALLGFLQSRSDAMRMFERARQPDHIILWPIDPNFEPQFCRTCLAPVSGLVPCRFCAPKGLRVQKEELENAEAEADEAIAKAAERGSLVRVILGANVYRGALIAKNDNVVSIRLRGHEAGLPRIGEAAELILEKSYLLHRYAVRVQRVERLGEERRMYLNLLGLAQ